MSDALEVGVATFESSINHIPFPTFGDKPSLYTKQKPKKGTFGQTYVTSHTTIQNEEMAMRGFFPSPPFPIFS